MKPFLFAACLLLPGLSLAGDNIPLEQAKEAGIKQCLPAIQKVSEFLLKGGTHGAMGTWFPERPDKEVYASMIERTFSDTSQIFSLVVTPIASGECPTVYERIAYFSESCVSVAKGLTSHEDKGELDRRVSVLSKKNKDDVYLMSIANGCLRIQREVIADGNNP